MKQLIIELLDYDWHLRLQLLCWGLNCWKFIG